MEFYAAERKEELIPCAMAWVKVVGTMLSEIRQVLREKYYLAPLACTAFSFLFFFFFFFANFIGLMLTAKGNQSPEWN